MRRRSFLSALVGTASVGCTSSLWAQHLEPGRLPSIGFLGANTPATQNQWTAAFINRLNELGWIADRNIIVTYRWAEGRNERVPELLQEFLRLKVDVIVTSGGSLVAAAKQATTSIPIVFAIAADPVGNGLVNSLARPGGNATGLSVQYTDLASKRIELLREILPRLLRLAILVNSEALGSMLEMRAAQATAKGLGLEVQTLEIKQAEDIAGVFEKLKDAADALYVCSDPLVGTHRAQINGLALSARLPTVHSFREHVEAGALMSYGASFPDMFRRAGDYVDKILRGAKPSDLPVEQPTKFELAINLQTAKAIGITIAPMLLARADEVIE